MNELLGNIYIKVDEKIYLKDPGSSEIGKNILHKGILLMDESGRIKDLNVMVHEIDEFEPMFRYDLG